MNGFVEMIEIFEKAEKAATKVIINLISKNKFTPCKEPVIEDRGLSKWEQNSLGFMYRARIYCRVNEVKIPGERWWPEPNGGFFLKRMFIAWDGTLDIKVSFEPEPTLGKNVVFNFDRKKKEFVLKDLRS